MQCFAAPGALILRGRGLPTQPQSCAASRRPPAVTCMAGFGPRAGGGFGSADGLGRGTPKKKQRTIRATYLELVQKGATEFVCYVRPQGSSDDGWRRVGTVVAENDECCVAVTNNKRVVLDHAKRLHPQLALVKALEVGIGKGDAHATPPVLCERSEGTVTSAFSPDATSTGSFFSSQVSSHKSASFDASSARKMPTGFKPRKTGEGKTPTD